MPSEVARERRTYVTDDADIDEFAAIDEYAAAAIEAKLHKNPMELRLEMGENGDWYLSIGCKRTSPKFSQFCVRVTTSGTRLPRLPAAMAKLYKALGPREEDPTIHEERIVGGAFMERTLAEFVQACEVHIEEEQAKASPDSALIGLLCDAVRLAREHDR